MSDDLFRYTIDLTGLVQGSGVRPALYRLAKEAGLGGYVQNRAATVRLVLEGREDQLSSCLASLSQILPLATPVIVQQEKIAASAIKPFTIEHSTDVDPNSVGRMPVFPDFQPCPQCWSEFNDLTNRRYRYPFISCPACGPRSTIISGLPYDRERTAMADFPLCSRCAAEYADPADRRFHAQNISCPHCGPTLWLRDRHGRELPIAAARQALLNGQCLALKGIGGYLLVVDAQNRATIAALREFKHRPHKPLAVMAASLALVERYFQLSAEEQSLLVSPAAPIVVLQPRDNCPLPLADLAPDNSGLGIMLPSSGLHAALFGEQRDALEYLVMTSGNAPGQPLCLDDDEALKTLAPVAHLFLGHNRRILRRHDDSLCVVNDGQTQVWRRGRGYSLQPLPWPAERSCLAMGADLKNAVAVSTGAEILLSPYIGDLDDPATLAAGEEMVADLLRLLRARPQVVGVDLHPDFRSRRLGETLAAKLNVPVKTVQHHYAHALAGLAERGRREGLALVFDGTGYGPDGTIWGAELLEIDATGYKRRGTFKASALIGGDRATVEPRRQLVARFWEAGLEIESGWRERLGVNEEELLVWKSQWRRGVNVFASHAAGRLFDAFAALLVPWQITYEGQAAVLLEKAAGSALRREGGLEFLAEERRGGLLQINWDGIFRQLAEMRPEEVSVAELAWSFHEAVARAAVTMIEYGLALRPDAGEVVLTGGVFMNRLLVDLLSKKLVEKGIEFFLPQKFPVNDGGIAVGQIMAIGKEVG